ncbi:MAG TPA: hypothetical protein VK041_03770 [Opitutales bacterium]|nr:hypothetical protein [Opitutales bacterium]
MDMIHHGTLDESDVFSQLILRHFDAEGARVSQIAMQAGESPGTFLGQDARWEVDTVNRFEVVMNNSADALTYTSPTGTDRTVDAGASDMWINGVLAFGNHTHGRHGRATPGPIMEIQLLTNPNNVWNADIARIQTLPGAQLVGVDGPSVPEGYSDWIETYFPGESDPELVGPDADPDGDGIPNLLEYALNREPNVASREALPFTEVQTVTVDGVEGRYLVLIGAVPDDMFDLQYSVEASSDVSFAEYDEGVPVDSWSNGDGTTTYVFRDVVPIGEDSRRFMRLRVTALD